MRAQIQIGPAPEPVWRRGSEEAAHTGSPRYYKSDLAEVAGNNLGFSYRPGRASMRVSSGGDMTEGADNPRVGLAVSWQDTCPLRQTETPRVSRHACGLWTVAGKGRWRCLESRAGRCL